MVNTHKKKAGVATLISDKINFIRDKKSLFLEINTNHVGDLTS